MNQTCINADFKATRPDVAHGAVILLLLMLGAVRVYGQVSVEHQAVKAGRSALESSGDFPWYDEAKDSIRRIDVVPPKDLSARKSRWQKTPSTWTWPEWLSKLFEVLAWILLIFIVFGLIYILTRAVMWDDWRSGAAGRMDDPLHGDIDRIESLPFQLQNPQMDLLAEARKRYEAGQFSEAMIYLYSYQLVELDRHQFIRLTKGKTNRQYLRELRSRRGLFDLLFHSMITFEAVLFGKHEIDRARFEVCWRGLDEFHQYLAQATA